MSVVETVLRRFARRLPARRRSVSVEVMRHRPEMNEGEAGRRRSAALCLAAMAVMTIVLAVTGLKFIQGRQALPVQNQAESAEVTAYSGSSRPILDISLLPGAAKSSTAAGGNTLGNSGVLKLKAAGFGDALIVQRIKMSRGDYRLEPDDLSELKKAGLSDVVISAMMTAATRRSFAH